MIKKLIDIILFLFLANENLFSYLLHVVLQSCIGEPPVHRDFHSATAIGSNMFIFGGRSDLSGVGTFGPDYYSNKVGTALYDLKYKIIQILTKAMVEKSRLPVCFACFCAYSREFFRLGEG